MTNQRVNGVDISHYQNAKIDYAKATAAGVEFIYHKATEGTSYKDPNYSKRRREAKRAGIPFGAYHFARAKLGDAVKQADYFLSVAKPKDGDLLPTLDLETTEGLTGAQLAVWAKAFSDRVYNKLGVYPVIYGPFVFPREALPGPRWVPRYNNSNTPPKQTDVDIWQFSNGVYGSPNQVAGFGHVDLNTYRGKFTLRNLIFKKNKDKEDAESVVLNLMHISLQFSDNPKQKEQDIKKLFDRAKKRNVAWITGTEAGHGAGPNRALLKKYSKASGYKFFIPSSGDSWIAVRKNLVTPGTWHTYYSGPVVDGVAKRWADKGVVSVDFGTENLGRITVVTTHYLTKGSPVAKNPARSRYVAQNKKLAKAIGAYARRMGRGRGLVFFGADTNIIDRLGDVFFGEPLTTAWDELKKWENTGHGNIDVIASYNRDGRVSAEYVRALDDREFFLNTDHFLVEAGYRVKLLK